MWIRMRFGIRWPDILMGFVYSFLPRGPGNSKLATRAVANWPQPGELLPCLAVRSGFDLLLQALQLPPGSEVLLSALTVPNMQTIVEHHGLKAVAVDLQPGGFRPDLDSLRYSITPNTRMLVVAHLFGDRIPMEPIHELANQHNVFVVEDCAQSFSGLSEQSHSDSDVAMFSFGPIKTATALQGAVLRVRDAELRERMRDIQNSYPVSSRTAFIRRLIRYSLLKLMTSRVACWCVVTACGIMKIDYDGLVNNSSTNFSPGQLIHQLRKRPSAGLLRLMRRRFVNGSKAEIQRRTKLGRLFDSHIGLSRPADDVYWVYPVVVTNPNEAVRGLRAAGFDATVQSRLGIVDSESGRTPQIVETYANTVFLPWYPGLSEASVLKMADIVKPFVVPSATANCQL